MRRRAVVAFAIISSVLLITAVPANVTAASNSTKLVVGSQHTDFGTGDEEEPYTQDLTIVGSGDDASLSLTDPATLEGFEDGDISEYSLNTSQFTVQQTTVKNGSYALEGTVSDTTAYRIVSTDFSVGDGNTYRANVRLSSQDMAAGVIFGTQDETSEDGYVVSLVPNNNDFRLDRRDDGDRTKLAEDTSVSYSTDSWYEIEFKWSSSGELTATLYNSSGSKVSQIQETDTTYTSGGVGWRIFGGSTNTANAYYDDLRRAPGGTGQYKSANHSITDPQQWKVNTTLENASLTARGEYYDGSGWVLANSTTWTTTANHTLELPSGVSSTTWRLNATFDNKSGETTAQLHDESILFTDHAPTVNESSASPSGNETIDSKTATLKIDVSDPEFGTVQGDEVTATAYDASDDSVIGSDTLTSNGTASVSWSSLETGTNSYYWVVEDSYGLSSTSKEFDFQVPGTLYVYNESQPSQLIEKNADMRARFFVQGQEEVVEKPITNGTVNLTGLPADNRIVITVKDDNDNFTYRRITIDSIVDQQDIYLLPTSVDSAQIVFKLDDPTGEFPPSETRLYVEKPIHKDFDDDGTNETQYRTISGDYFGSGGQYPAQLIKDERYRLRVVSDGSGSERVLGAYTVYGDVVEPLQIERIEPNSDTDASSSIYGSLDEVDGTPTIAVRFRDVGNSTDSVTYRVLNESGGVVVANTTSTAEEFAHMYQINTNNTTSYTVEYWIERPSETESGQFTIGQVKEMDWPADPQVLSIISWVVILATMGLLVIVDANLAPIGGVGMASALVIMGTVAIPMPILGVAGAISVLTLFGGGR